MFNVDKDENGQDVVQAEVLKKYHQLPDATEITYLSVAVSMICFIQIALNQLKSSSHSREYGKLGLVFEKEFLRTQDIQPVIYYTEISLWNDPLIVEWSNDRNSKDSKKRNKLEKEITLYRKPATYFPAFAEQKMMKVTTNIKGTILEHCHKYDRYEIGYDFRNEQEYRIAFEKGQDYMYFTEKDLYMIITPDLVSKSQIDSYLSKEWEHLPQVKVFPREPLINPLYPPVLGDFYTWGTPPDPRSHHLFRASLVNQSLLLVSRGCLTNRSSATAMGGRKLGPVCKRRQVLIQSRWHEGNNMFGQYSKKHATMPEIRGVPPCTGRQNMAAP
jgi:hypothetical protein